MDQAKAVKPAPKSNSRGSSHSSSTARLSEQEVAFRYDNLFSKADLIESFRSITEHFRTDRSYPYTKIFRARKVEFCKRFLAKLENCNFPKLTQRWWFYDFNLTGSAIEVQLCLADDRSIILENGEITDMSFTIKQTMLSLQAEYISVADYAMLQEVSTQVVEDWIPRGRLRNIKRIQDEWRISEIQDRPGREFESVAYIMQSPHDLQIEGYPVVSICDGISIYHDMTMKKYVCRCDNDKEDFHENLYLSRKEVEDLEFKLISADVPRTETILFAYSQPPRKLNRP